MKRKTRSIVFFLSILFSISCYSQTKDSIDFKSNIEKTIKNTTSKYFFPTLKNKFSNNPSKINKEDCFFMYYGQVFVKNHLSMPLVVNTERLNFDKAIMTGDNKKAIEYGLMVLEENPVDLAVLLHVCNCIKDTEYNDTAYFFEQRLSRLLEAILSTGNGKTMNSAIKIVSMEDKYVLKGVLEFLGGKEKIVSENNHEYSVWNKKGRSLYFENLVAVE